MEKIITIYHGSEQIVEEPTFGKGKKHNDFGLGFYCTESDDLAKEWAVSSLRNGFSNKYTLDTEYLNILNLNSPDYTILNWIAVLVEHRVFSLKTPVARRAKRYLIDNFSVNVNATICSGNNPGLCLKMWDLRCVITSVFPEPAHAIICRLCSISSTADCCSFVNSILSRLYYVYVFFIF